MDLAKLKALIDLVAGSRVAELEIVEGEERIRITRSVAPAEGPTRPAERRSTTTTPAPAVEPQSSTSDPHPDDIVRAPMYGVFHRTPSPDAAPFVEVGKPVQPGQTLCLIEAMKAFNAVTAERAGTIAAILAEGGQEVDQGQPLFRIE